jgi:hypothetical protein
MIVNREFLNKLKIMDVMEDWGSEFGGRHKIATLVVQKLREARDEEVEILIEALHILCPKSVFAYECDNLMVMTNDHEKLPIAVRHHASYIEEMTEGQMKVVKIRHQEHKGTLRKWLQEAISFRSSLTPDCG